MKKLVSILGSCLILCSVVFLFPCCSKQQGCDGCPCYPNSTCDAGLVCNASNICEKGTTDLCEGVICSGHGTCEVVGDQANCNCDSGYHAEGLSCVNNWNTDFAQMPTPVWDSAAAYSNGKVYVIAGEKAGQTFLDILQIYDIDSNSWSFGAQLPEGRQGHSAVGVGDEIYVVGGRNSSNISVNSVFVYNTISDQWSNGVDYPTDRFDSSPNVLFYNGKIYVPGGGQKPCTGCGSSPISDVYVFDISQGTWSPAPSLQTATHHFGLVQSGDEMIVLGGVINISGSSTSVVQRWKIGDPSWSTITPLPENMRFLGGAYLGSYIYIVHGDKPDSSSVVNDVMIYDVVQDQWNTGDPLPAELQNCTNLMALEIDGLIWVLGGHRSGEALGKVATYYPPK